MIRRYKMDEKVKWLNKGRLMAYVDDNVVLEPPCYNEIISDIWSSYKHICYSKNNETIVKKMEIDYPDISKDDLNMLINYFKKVKDYINSLCCAFAGIYQTIGVPETEDAQKDVLRLIKACKKRYSWLDDEDIVSILPGICWACNR